MSINDEIGKEPLKLFVDPRTGQRFKSNTDKTITFVGGNSYTYVDGVIDFHKPVDVVPTPTKPSKPNVSKPSKKGTVSSKTTNAAKTKTEKTRNAPPPAPTLDVEDVESAPELREAYDQAFEAAREDGGNIYGALEDTASVIQSGHYARMGILNSFELGDLSDKVVVDFGTGPWGFGAIFENIQKAGTCIGFDVSKTALELARNITPKKRSPNTIFATCDGEKFPLKDKSVDVFFGGEVIEHVRNPYLFMQEIARVCKNNAVVILTTPNKDALSYNIHGLEYAVGPEHIALLNHDEFHDIVKSFSKAVEIVGYETSIGPGEDALDVTEDQLAHFQKRALTCPELSTGLISYSKVNKTLYSKNKRSLKLSEALSTKDVCKYSAEPSTLTLHGALTGTLMQLGSTLKIPVVGQYVSLLFWCHDWSGEVEVKCGRQTFDLDLYSRFSGFKRFDFENPKLAKSVTIKPKGTHSEKSNDNQVIFYKIIQYREVEND